MSIYRSEIMELFHIAMSKESAYEVLSELGDISKIQFIDQTPDEAVHNRYFYKDIKRCEDLEGKLDNIRKLIIRYKQKLIPERNVSQYLTNIKEFMDTRDKAPHTYLDEIEQQIESKEDKLQEQVANLQKFEQKVISLHEERAVIQHCKEVLQGHLYGRQNHNIEEDQENQDGILQDVQIGIHYMAGVINTSDLLRFKRMIFRATRSNSWTSTNDIPPYEAKNEQKDLAAELSDPQEVQGEDLSILQQNRKSAFLIIYQGGATNAMKNKIIRIADSFGCTRYPLPAESHYMKKIVEIESQILEYTNTQRLTQSTIMQLLQEWSEPKDQDRASFIDELILYLTREKTIYTNMNLLKTKNEIYDGYYWCPSQMASDVQNAIRCLHARRSELPQTTITIKNMKNKTPPTYFQTNDFTAPFQEIVDTYGMARYQEINPGIFCVSMFPIKFGIMFGDIGHGGLLLIVGALLTYYGDFLKNNGMEDFAYVRYLLLLMGLFACYFGFLYNDFFSLPFNLFGSCFENIPGTNQTAIIPNCTYPLGIDPKWYIAKNELAFMNSLKMKIAVIVGVLQMLFGILLRGINSLFHRQYVDFFFEFLPQFTFLTCTFGYMDYMIFYKWQLQYDGENTAYAPSIISLMINLPLALGSTEGAAAKGHGNLWDQEAQESLQFNLLCIAIICVPLMLFPKPIIIFIQNMMKNKSSHVAKNQNQSELQQVLLNEEDHLNETLKAKKAEAEDVDFLDQDDGHGDHDEFGEICVHQVIETIEFVLGCVSKTASYLRLWALSLAHSQLAKVFFEKTIGGGISSGNILVIFIGWFFFVNITLGVIMAMDLMECFLHALRLQWVEFQGQFYKADGYKFEPFSFQTAIKTKQSEQAQGPN